MVHWSGVFGPEAANKIVPLSIGPSSEYEKASQVSIGKGWAISVQDSENPLVPPSPIWSSETKNLGISLHGAVFLRDVSIDELMSSPEEHFSHLLDEMNNNLNLLPSKIANGSYVGGILEPDKENFHVFTDPFGLIPLYYSQIGNHLFFSTEIHLLAQHPDIPKEWFLPALNEYLEYGAIISSNTILKSIKCLPIASMLSFSSNKVSVKRWHSFPKESSYKGTFKECLGVTYSLWKKAIDSLQSNKIKTCLSLSGGMDSRLIFTQWPKKETLITETGDSHNSADYIFARKLVETYKMEKNHILEPNHEDNFFNEYINYLLIIDNPLIANMPFPLSHLRWKKEIGTELLMLGAGGETLGSDHIWHSHDVIGLLKEAFFPFRLTPMPDGKTGIHRRGELLDIAFNRTSKNNMVHFFKHEFQKPHNHFSFREKMVKELDSYIGEVHSEEAYLERLRRAFKDQYFFSHTYLPGRKYHETIQPYFDTQFMNHLASIPIKYKSYRKFMFSFLNTFYPKAQDVPITTSFLKAKRPYSWHRFLKPFVKGINLGYKKRIPFLQPKNMAISQTRINLIKKRKGLFEFIKQVILKSSFFTSEVSTIIENFEGLKSSQWTSNERKEWESLWRLFSLGLTEKRLLMNQSDYEKWIKGTAKSINEDIYNKNFE